MTAAAIFIGSIIVLVGLWGVSGELKRIGNALCGTAWQDATWGETPLVKIAERLEELRVELANRGPETGS